QREQLPEPARVSDDRAARAIDTNKPGHAARLVDRRAIAAERAVRSLLNPEEDAEHATREAGHRLDLEPDLAIGHRNGREDGDRGCTSIRLPAFARRLDDHPFADELASPESRVTRNRGNNAWPRERVLQHDASEGG